MELPSHPDTDDTATDQEPATTTSWTTRLFVAFVVALFALIVILHLTGVVGPAAH